jgi:hypothetical protein
VVRRDEIAPGAAAVVAVLAAALGGAFWPLPRLVIGALFMVVWLIAAREWRSGLARDEVLAVSIVFWGAIAAAWVGAAPLASKEAIGVWVVAVALWCIARRGSSRVRSSGLWVVAFGAAIIAVAVLVEAALTRAIRVGGLLENPNLAVALLVPTLPLGFVVFGSAAPWRRWIWVGVVGAGIVATGSRAGLLALVVVVALLLPRGRVRLLGSLSGAGLAFVVLVWRFVNQPDVLAWHRVSIWWAVVKVWAERPLTGVGPGSLVEAAGAERILHADHIGRYQFVASYAESTPLAILVQIGLVGFGLALLALTAWWVGVARRGVAGSSEFRATVAAIVTLALFHDLLTADPVLWWWAVLIGLQDQGRCSNRVRGGNRPSTSVRTAVALVVAWLTAWTVMTPSLARFVWRDSAPTREVVERCLRIEPWLSDAPGARARHLLETVDPWSWETAAEAVHWAGRALAGHPGLARRWSDLGRVHLRIIDELDGTDHDVAAARRCLARACELDPRLPWHWLERARLERMTGDLETAVRFTRTALANEPNTIRGWIFLGRLELEAGHVGAARDALAEAGIRMRLAEQPGLSPYETELLWVPAAQLESLRNDLAPGPTDDGAPK